MRRSLLNPKIETTVVKEIRLLAVPARVPGPGMRKIKLSFCGDFPDSERFLVFSARPSYII
jgi:hypothetical protein